ncbi:uncharacterized protein LOC126749032 [Anthonomus grandis grandis]|uniref:uncharacterized protein LOC126749032 n=1 Tax=Anthonomus grandis grandis TaxID=2921223 RepID=UPI0021659AEC|nr:uncharacterized protein LOC126749032 [Anthonomus grandis grandis]
MGGCRCSYKSCLNTTKLADNIHFFHFPVNNRERCITWIENSGKPNFYDLEEDQLRNKVICEVHFEEKYFTNNQRRRLALSAIPTLDGDYMEQPTSPMEPDPAPVYTPSNQYNDVRVIPANDDGTVFVLDTENMFTISPKIESYIIKNGVLVKTNSAQPTRNTQGKPAKPPTSNRFTKVSGNSCILTAAEKEIANINTPPGPTKTVKPTVVQPSSSSMEVVPIDNEEQESVEVVYENGSSEPQKPEVVTPSAPKPGVNKNYLKKIKQHSRDIASIKRMLKEKIMEPPKPDIKTILSELQPQIPASLFTIISLILGEKNELDEEDIEFFTTFHRGSPETYQMLSLKYKWNLPSVDIVETSE